MYTQISLGTANGRRKQIWRFNYFNFILFTTRPHQKVPQLSAGNIHFNAYHHITWLCVTSGPYVLHSVERLCNWRPYNHHPQLQGIIQWVVVGVFCSCGNSIWIGSCNGNLSLELQRRMGDSRVIKVNGSKWQINNVIVWPKCLWPTAKRVPGPSGLIPFDLSHLPIHSLYPSCRRHSFDQQTTPTGQIIRSPSSRANYRFNRSRSDQRRESQIV